MHTLFPSISQYEVDVIMALYLRKNAKLVPAQMNVIPKYFDKTACFGLLELNYWLPSVSLPSLYVVRSEMETR